MNKIKYLTTAFGLLFFLTSLQLSPPIYADEVGAPTQTVTSLNFSLGNLCEYIGKIQTNENGGKNVCSFLPSLSASYDFNLTPSFILSPQLGATLPKSGRDKNIKRMTLFVLGNGIYKTPYVNLIGGMGFYFTRIAGPGGEEILDNGNDTDSFPLPKDAVYSRNFIVNLGLGRDFSDKWSAEVTTYIFNLTKSEDRAFSAGAYLTYHYGEIF